MKKFIFLFILALVILMGCSSDDTPTEPDEQNDLILKKIEFSNEATNGFEGLFFDTKIDLDFNEDDILTLINTDVHESTLALTFENDENKISMFQYSFAISGGFIRTTFNFSYSSDDKISSLERIVEGSFVNEEDTYSIAYLENTRELTNNGSGELYTVILTEEGLLSSITNGNRSYEYEYDADGNLLIKTDEQGKQLAFSYDDKRNPFVEISPFNWNEVLPIVLSSYLDLPEYTFPHSIENGVWNSPNNILSVDASQCDNGTSCMESRTYIYEYNSDDYPKFKTIVDKNRTFEYLYE